MSPTVPELGRFAEPALLILVSLSDGPKHGYAIMLSTSDVTQNAMNSGRQSIRGRGGSAGTVRDIRATVPRTRRGWNGVP